ncbi:MAG TPA: hypothetical protein VHL78_04300 [Actinomycetota bacterium]|nr:hypothetical protein [Actinomycetota bacterium]
MRRRALALVAAVVLAACGPDGRSGEGPAPPGTELVAQVASYDLAADMDARLMVGLLTTENEFVSGGTVDMTISFLGETRAEGRPEVVHEVTGRFLPLPGSPEPKTDRPFLGPASEGQGVYEVEPIRFDRPGIYEAEVTADLGGGDVRSGTAAFQVLPEPLVPAPGDRAPRTENLTVASDAPPVAVDSRAETGGRIPDPDLHRTTIADAMASGRPVLAVFATPVYCVSRFCGPVTEMVEDLADEHGGDAAFIHVEIWRDFQEQVVNRAAAEWLLHDGNLNEPWVFAIDADGRIAARWDNVADRSEIEAWLERLA